MNRKNVFSIDVEEWFHILDTPCVPDQSKWGGLELRAAASLECLLSLLQTKGIRATFFWLGWCAERHPELVKRCADAGHEIASHTYSHKLVYEMTPEAFREDIQHAKHLLEDIAGKGVSGIRLPGFSVNERALWVFDIVREVGYDYDSSVFPATRGHGGMADTTMEPHLRVTKHGSLVEIPISVVELLRQRLCLFGGGYLRLSPLWLIRLGIQHLSRHNRPLILYIHPREIDPNHPRLPMSFVRRFKSYVNLTSTLPKLNWICDNNTFVTMGELAQEVRAGNEVF